MRECQLCGAKSWGPIPDEFELSHSLSLLNLPRANFLLCDNCGTLANSLIIEKPAPAPDAQFHIGPFGDPMHEAGKILGNLLPKQSEPETRLERIVRDVIRSDFELVMKEDEKIAAEELADRIVRLGAFIDIKISELSK